MKNFSRGFLGLALGAAVLTSVLRADSPPSGQVSFGKLTPSGSGEFVEVNITGNLLGIAARLAGTQEPEVAELLRGLHSVRVNVVGMDDSNRSATEACIQTLRTDLDAKGWERIVAVKEKNQDVGVYIKTRGPEAVEGLVITVVDGKHQAVLVNIVGDIKPEKVAALAEKLHLAPLQKAAKAFEKK